MVRFGAVIVRYRAQLADALDRYAARHHRECSGGRERLEVRYQTVSSVTDPSADIGTLTEQLRTHMASHQAAERASRLCLSGPHKDDLLISIDGREAKSYSSQGQTGRRPCPEAGGAGDLSERHRRVAGAAAGRCAQRAGPTPAGVRPHRIAGGQVFITCCEDDRLPAMLGGKVFHVKQGTIG